MKATTIIIAAALTLSVNILFANNDSPSVSAPVANVNTTISLTSLAPSIPLEADFEDAVEMVDFSVLSPVTPVEAQFEDMTYEMVSDLNLAPVTPASADVDESEDFSFLAPVAPAKADFE